MKKILTLILLSFSLNFTSCIQLSETLLLKEDARLDFHFSLQLADPPKEGKDKGKPGKEGKQFQENIRMIQDSMPQSVQFEQKDVAAFGLKKFQFLISVKDFGDLQKFYQSFSKTLSQKIKKKSQKSVKAKKKKKKDQLKNIFAQSFNSKSFFKIKKTKKGTLRITRHFKPSKKKKEKKSDKKKDMSAGFAKMMVAMFKFRFEFYSPTQILGSNAHEQVGQLLRWETNAAYLDKKPFDLWVEIAATPELLAAF